MGRGCRERPESPAAEALSLLGHRHHRVDGRRRRSIALPDARGSGWLGRPEDAARGEAGNPALDLHGSGKGPPALLVRELLVRRGLQPALGIRLLRIHPPRRFPRLPQVVRAAVDARDACPVPPMGPGRIPAEPPMGRTSTAERTAMDQPASQARHRTGRPLRVKDNPSNPSPRAFSGPLFVSKEPCADRARERGREGDRHAAGPGPWTPYPTAEWRFGLLGRSRTPGLLEP